MEVVAGQDWKGVEEHERYDKVRKEKTKRHFD